MYPSDLETTIRQTLPGIYPWLDQQPSPSMVHTAAAIRQATGFSVDASIDLAPQAILSHAWAKSGRIIYQVDPTVTQEFLSQVVHTEDSETLPAALVRNLPHACFAINFSPFFIDCKGMQSQGDYRLEYTGRCLVRLFSGEDLGTPWPAVYSLWDLGGGKTTGWYFPVLEGTYGDCMAHLLDELQTNVPEKRLTMDDIRLEMVPSALVAQLILYLQSESADLQRRPSSPPAKKAKGKGRSPKPPKVIDVGCHVGRVIRQHRAAEAAAPAAPGTGSSKRPHSRRAHWHHYWTGPKADPSKRTLVLKWVPPTFIHAGKPSDSKPTLRRIAPEKNGK